MTSRYHLYYYTQGDHLMYALHMDWEQAVPDGNLYSNFTEIQDENISIWQYMELCLHTGMMSWIGGPALIKDNGMNVFFNRDQDSIFIRVDAGLNDDFVFNKYPDNSHFLATVTSVEYMSFLGISDSVKTLTLQYYNTQGLPASSGLNGMELMLTKNYGFYKTLNFREFPGFGNETYSVVEHTLFGHGNIENSFRKMTMRDVFDFETGDEYHYHRSIGGGGFSWYGNKIRTILDKHWVASDEVIYTICQEAWGYDGPVPFYNMYHTIDTISETYSDIDTLVMEQLPFEPYELAGGNYINVYYPIYYIIDSSDFPTLARTIDGFVSINSDSCFHRWWFDSYSIFSTEYIKGCGKLTNSDSFDPGSWSDFESFESLAYCKKGENEWGTALVPPTVGTRNFSSIQNDLIFYPNPAKDHIEIFNSRSPLLQGLFLSITDSQGKVYFSEAFDAGNTIDVSGWAEGIYVFSLRNKDFCKNGKIVIQR
nr:T9SS type A sorting domain-containing protein [Bacteroidota bacterium]